jgi:hypothetical protein
MQISFSFLAAKIFLTKKIHVVPDIRNLLKADLKADRTIPDSQKLRPPVLQHPLNVNYPDRFE